ncbi:hypothetical protein CR194_13800 [Salipaludibacillus keqinensis]|uniref:Uncharacterized protein n=1 Tax=Salipaludibacillus keqinensis TaxID=2045207 RepID=A0A323TFK5_9BACI|nr:5'-nucleotidase C-terminal domain-containing protein [Salipaludibacillus keqinensis]PYZ92724.1 hypothetical protein CR194_13800 [Salipaludibacillus keqinensis]
MEYRSRKYRKFFATIMAVILIVATMAPAVPASANQGGNSENAGPKRSIEAIELIDSTSFIIDFDKTYPKGIDINRMIDVKVDLDDDTIIEPELTDYKVSSEDRSQVTVEHVNDDLDGLAGKLSINDFEVEFDYRDEAERYFSLDIFHTNDIHSKIDHFGKISAFINEQGEEASNHLYLDAGDIFSGNAVVDLQEGEPIVELLNEMGLDAMAIGNHEFDYGQEAFAAREEQANFDWLSANMEVVDPEIPIKQPEPYEIYEIDGVNVGIFSLTQNPPATRLSGIAGIDFHDYVETAEHYAYLQDETDILIALTHIGNSADKNLAENIDFFDVIIGGHSHSRIFEADVVNGTPVVQAGSDALFVGHFNLEFDGTDVTFNDYYLQDVDELTEVNQDVQDMVDAYNAEAEELLKEVVGFTNTGLSRDARWARDTSLGNFWTDSMKEALNADMAITNNGGIRANIEEGDITAGDIYTVEPFGNELSELEITGEDLREVIEYSYSYRTQNDLQTSGLTFTIYVDENDQFVDADLFVDGEPIDDNATYTLVTNNFMAEGGDGYDFSSATVIQEAAGYVTTGMFQLMEELMESEGAVDYEDGEGRIQIVEEEENGEDEFEGSSIMEMREAELGTSHTIRGVVTAYFESGGQTNMYIQDETAAVLVRGSGLGSQYNTGDKVQFTGESDEFRDMVQLMVSDSELVERNHGEITPQVVDSTFFENNVHDLQAQLIEIKDVHVNDNPEFDDFNAEDSAGDFMIYGAYADVEEDTQYDSITGVVNYHFYENKLMPRNDDDLVEDASVVQPPRANQASGAVASGTEIVLSTSTEDAEIYYTLNGEDPTDSDTLYDSPITITEETTVKAVAVKDGLENSVVREFNYTLLAEAGELEIYDIQGASHISPYEGQVVREVQGIVTHTENNGFYFQTAESDGDVNTSEGIYVYKRNHGVDVGDEVLVDGKVVEYEESGFHDFSSNDNDDLRTTQIEASQLDVQSSGNDLPAPVVIGIDREIPGDLLADPENYDIYDPAQFDAEVNALDFYESLEGMLVEIPGQVTITGPQKYDELTVISEEWGLENRTESGSVYLQENEHDENYAELNTEVMFVNAPRGTIAKTGDYFEESIVGVVGYNFSNFKIEPIEGGLPELQDGELERRDETTIEFEEDKLTVATYNVENFHPNANSERTRRLADSMANELNSPDILTLVEVMDNYGESVGPDTDASASYQTLIDAIKEKTGVQYAFTEVAPIQGNDGGIPGGNIRVGHIYRVDRVELANDTVGPNDEGITIDEEGNLSYGTGLIDPTNEAFERSRKPLLTEFIFKGEPVYVIGNHWNSKLGDEAPFGMVQPAMQGSREQRMEIASIIGDFIAELNEKTEGDPNVVVLGDFNDYPWSPPVTALTETGNLYNSLFELDRSEQYTYSYNGSTQSLDSILVSEHLKDGLEVDAMGINSEFMWEHGRASDHDPMMVQLEIPNIDPDYDMGDVLAPVITFVDEELNEEPTIYLNVGDEFEVPSVTAEDNVDGDVTDEVEVTNNVDTSISGTYEVRYTVTDEAGNTAVKVLNVIVQSPMEPLDELLNGSFENWSNELPENWFGESSNIAMSRVVQSDDAYEGDSSAQLINTGTTHNRFTTDSYAIEEGVTYEVSFWVKGNGDIRNAMYAPGYHGNNYSNYSPYTEVRGEEWQQVTWEYEAPGNGEAEIIFSVRNTSEDNLFIDGVEVNVAD